MPGQAPQKHAQADMLVWPCKIRSAQLSCRVQNCTRAAHLQMRANSADGILMVAV